jgi:hypothetical protein
MVPGYQWGRQTRPRSITLRLEPGALVGAAGRKAPPREAGASAPGVLGKSVT